MARRLVISLALMALTLLLTGTTFANAVGTLIVFGPSNTAVFAIGGNTITMDFTGPASSPLFPTSLPGNFILAGMLSITAPSDEGEVDVFGPPGALTFTVTFGPSDQLVGSLSVGDGQMINGQHTFFEGTLSIQTSTGGFSSAYPVGSVADLNFVTDDLSGITILSSGEVDPAIPEPQTLILVGYGLLGMAAMVRRKRSA